VTADSATIAEIAASPKVAYIEKDAKIYASSLTSQSGAPYGLGRISHRNQDSTIYIYDSSAGSDITVYLRTWLTLVSILGIANLADVRALEQTTSRALL